MTEPLVSAVMLSFNNIDIIGTTLSELSKSSIKNMEVIVLDCGSKDGSAGYIAKNFPWVKLVKFRADPGQMRPTHMAFPRQKAIMSC